MEKTGRSSKKEAREEKLKEQKLEEVILKSLDECSSGDDKLQLMLRKHIENEKKIITLCADLKSYQRNLDLTLREKEQMQRELNKSVLMRDKLQEVCREQQKIIKSVKNESLLKIREEEERRKESQYKFQTSLNEITQSLSKNNEENLKLRDYNIEMTKKLKYLAEQYQTREKQLEKLNEQVQLESQLHQAKLNKAQVEAAMEKEILSKENQIGLEKLLQAQRTIKELSEREQELKHQLHIYTSKYDEFQKSLQKSNEMFVSYKAELEKMSKHTKKIEKDALGWRMKYEKSNAMVIELATEKQLRDEHAERCNKQVDQLQKLLRALQTERTNLHKTLRENNIEIPPMPALPAEPEPMKVEPVNSDKDKMELMSRNCAQLKETLSNLQNQMKILTTENKEAAVAAAAAQQQQQQQQRQDEIAKQNKNKKKKNKKAAQKRAQKEQSEAEAEVEVETNEADTEVDTVPCTEVADALPEANPDRSETDVQTADAVVTTDTNGNLATDAPVSDVSEEASTVPANETEVCSVSVELLPNDAQSAPARIQTTASSPAQ